MGSPHRPSVGLKRGTVALRPYDSAWVEIAHEEIATIHDALQGVAVDAQHVGSTAVPGVLSKPIIDIAVAAPPPLNAEVLVQRLTSAGYVFRGDKGTEGGLLFVRTDEQEVRTVHVHVVSADSIEWANYLRFRDMLRRDPRLRDAYERLKRDAAARFPHDRASYTAAKHVFIRGALSDDGRVDDDHD
jgi:GrpB-like predicted nucleotidyltransferase (UPF0157 family)